MLAEQLARQFEDSNLEIEVRAPGAIVDFTSAYDVCDGLIKMTRRTTPEDFVFASGRAMSIADIVNGAQLILGLPITRFQNVESVSGGLVGNITKARDSLDWAPTASPAEVLAHMTEALRKSKNV
jgi:nucleoside-diphosphate-sugar epimerase